MAVERTGTACTWCHQQPGVKQLDGRCARCMALFQVQRKMMGRRWCRMCGSRLCYPDMANQREALEWAVKQTKAMLCTPKCKETLLLGLL